MLLVYDEAAKVEWDFARENKLELKIEGKREREREREREIKGEGERLIGNSA